MSRCIQLACAFIVVLTLPGTAEASVVSVTRTEGWDGGEPVLDVSLSYTALVGETNRLRVEQASGGGLLFSDRGVERIFEAQDGCEQVTAQQVVCRPDPYEDVLDLGIRLGDRADRAVVLSTDLDTEPGGGLALALDGGGGPDLLRTRVQGKIFGRGGNDRISAMSGGSRDRSNRVFCGSGRDRVFVDRTFFADADDCERVAHRAR